MSSRKQQKKREMVPDPDGGTSAIPQPAILLDQLLQVVERNRLSPLVRQQYLEMLTPQVQRMVREACNDPGCTATVEGSVSHNTALRDADADIVIRKQGGWPHAPWAALWEGGEAVAGRPACMLLGV